MELSNRESDYSPLSVTLVEDDLRRDFEECSSLLSFLNLSAVFSPSIHGIFCWMADNFGTGFVLSFLSDGTQEMVFGYYCCLSCWPLASTENEVRVLIL